MEKLIEGVHKFHNDEFGNYRSLFRKLSQEGQNPHTLFITCSDSRVLAAQPPNGVSLFPGQLRVVFHGEGIRLVDRTKSLPQLLARYHPRPLALAN